MTIEEKMFDIMRNRPLLTAIIPEERIKPGGMLQNLTRPYLGHGPVSVQPIHTHGGLAALQTWRDYDISIVAGSPGMVATIRDLLISQLDGYCDASIDRIKFKGIGPRSEDLQLNVYGQVVSFQISEALRA